MSDWQVFLQQIITGLSNGMIIALIALGYTMVYGIVELINFAHGDLFMLGAFLALTLVGVLGLQELTFTDAPVSCIAVLLLVPLFCLAVNGAVDRFAYRPLRTAPRLAPLVSAIGVSFVFVNLGLFWGGLPLDVFGGGRSAASPKDFPALLPNSNLLTGDQLLFTVKDLLVFIVAVPAMIGLTCLVKYTALGRAMRAVAQDPAAAKLMGVDVDLTINRTFMIGGALAGLASVIYALYNNTIYFQMGFRVGIDAFTAAVLGGIGNFAGAMLGGILIGIIRAFSDQYISAQWTGVTVFVTLLLVLVLKPSGLLGRTRKEKV